MKESISFDDVARRPEVADALIFFVLHRQTHRKIQGKGIEEILPVAEKFFKSSFISYRSAGLFPIIQQGSLAKTISKYVGE